MSVSIDVISDVVCPWCFIGKRKLERALDSLSDAENPAADVTLTAPTGAGASAANGVESVPLTMPEIVWHPFQLNPELPASGMARADYLVRKFGPDGGKRNYDRVRAAGAAVGIEFDFERIVRQPNTLAAHALIAMAGQIGRQGEMVEALFTAYFLRGEDIGERSVLEALASSVGLTAADVDRALTDESVRSATAQSDQQAREIGVQGVPFFIFDRRLAVSGAQDPEVLLDAMQQAARDKQTPSSPGQ